MLQAGAQIDADMLAGFADRRLHPTAAAREAGVSRGTVARAAARHGVVLPRGTNVMRIDHREAVQDMKPLDAVEYLLGVIETFMPPIDLDLAWNWPGERMTPQEKRLVRVLAMSHVPVPRDVLFGALQGDRVAPRIEASDKLVDVVLARVRRKVAPQGVRIVNHYGHGWTVEAPAGFVWPWEAEA